MFLFKLEEGATGVKDGLSTKTRELEKEPDVRNPVLRCSLPK